MLIGKSLGQAIAEAIRKKIATGAIKTKAEVAHHFGVRPASMTDWTKSGTISKDKLPELWRFFSDVAGPEHWGMSESEWPAGLSNETASEVKEVIDAEHLYQCLQAVTAWVSAGRRMQDERERVELACHLYEFFMDEPASTEKMVKFLEKLSRLRSKITA